jgi:hypothetical protein
MKTEGYLLRFFMHYIKHCFICRHSDYTVSGDAGIEPMTVATLALAVRRSNHSGYISSTFGAISYARNIF